MEGVFSNGLGVEYVGGNAGEGLFVGRQLQLEGGAPLGLVCRQTQGGAHLCGADAGEGQGRAEAVAFCREAEAE